MNGIHLALTVLGWVVIAEALRILFIRRQSFWSPREFAWIIFTYNILLGTFDTYRGSSWKWLDAFWLACSIFLVWVTRNDDDDDFRKRRKQRWAERLGRIVPKGRKLVVEES